MKKEINILLEDNINEQQLKEIYLKVKRVAFDYSKDISLMVEKVV